MPNLVVKPSDNNSLIEKKKNLAKFKLNIMVRIWLKWLNLVIKISGFKHSG
jgi:hypothetical protein